MAVCSHRILLVDDRVSTRQSWQNLLASEGYAIDQAADAEEAIERLRVSQIDLVLTDVRMKREDDGFELLRLLKTRWPSVGAILYTGWPDPTDADLANDLGADDYFSLPLSDAVLLNSVKKAVSRRQIGVRPTGNSLTVRDRIIAASPAMQAVLFQASRIAARETPVLITGETGTGKELLARVIHGCSRRATGPFVAVNCGAIAAGMAEAELFGYRKGAFTSAETHKVGLVEAGHSGTLFLDEVGELPLAMQPALLRFLDCGDFRRLGETDPRRADVRVIAATNRPLRADAACGRFREDLYFRLAVATCRVPPLRQRPEDIRMFLDRWQFRYAGETGRHVALTIDAVQRLLRYDWPGNFRELRSVLERAALTSPESIGAQEIEDAMDLVERTIPEGAPMEQPTGYEKARVLEALKKHHGNKGEAAASLGISRTTLWRRIKHVTGFPPKL